MTVALEPTPPRLGRASSTTSMGLVGVAGLTSLAAGAIHAAAVGVHAEHRPAALVFTAVATLQLAWGGLALVRSGRLVAILGGLIGEVAIAGWVMAKVSGIPFVDGLDDSERVQMADAVASGLAAATVVLVAVWLLRQRRGSAEARVPMVFASVGVTMLAVVGDRHDAGGRRHGRRRHP